MRPSAFPGTDSGSRVAQDLPPQASPCALRRRDTDFFVSHIPLSPSISDPHHSPHGCSIPSPLHQTFLKLNILYIKKKFDILGNIMIPFTFYFSHASEITQYMYCRDEKIKFITCLKKKKNFRILVRSDLVLKVPSGQIQREQAMISRLQVKGFTLQQLCKHYFLSTFRYIYLLRSQILSETIQKNTNK